MLYITNLKYVKSNAILHLLPLKFPKSALSLSLLTTRPATAKSCSLIFKYDLNYFFKDDWKCRWTIQFWRYTIKNDQLILLYISKQAVMLPIKFILICFCLCNVCLFVLSSCQTCVRANRRDTGVNKFKFSVSTHPCMSFEALKLFCMHEIVKLFLLMFLSFPSLIWFRPYYDLDLKWSMKTGLSFIVKWSESDDCCNALLKPMFLCSIFIVLFKNKC